MYWRWAGFLALPAILAVVLPVGLGESAVHIAPQFRWKPDTVAADRLAPGRWRPVEIQADDSVTLRGSLFRPEKPNGGAVILLHGVASSRDGMLGHARVLLEAGYICLLPDSRGHGVSGDDLVSYGLKEAGDVARWARFLQNEPNVARLYGLGESMGAAVLLESLPQVPQFQAVVAECGFYDFPAVARDRLAQFTGLGPSWMYAPVAEAGLLYVRLRYGLRLADASPAEGLRRSSVRVLLVHGTDDRNIPPEHSERLAALRRPGVTLWRVPGAGHVAALSKDPAGFHARILEWFTIEDRQVPDQSSKVHPAA